MANVITLWDRQVGYNNYINTEVVGEGEPGAEYPVMAKGIKAFASTEATLTTAGVVKQAANVATTGSVADVINSLVAAGIMAAESE